MNIILIGMPTSGKSTVGVILAKELGMDFMDTDLLLQKCSGQRLCDMISHTGMNTFLAAEEQLCLQLSVRNTVIATGGSVIYGEKAMEHFRTLGRIFYLEISLNTLKERLQDARQRGVVLRDGQSIDSLYTERSGLYRRWADVTIREQGYSLEETVQAVIRAHSLS